jgi:LuxR family maltose regulon positive regulatory protein
MPTPILATKLYLPLPQPNGVRRPRLIDLLEAGVRRPGHKLTLISAPAGFGKTTLVSDWVTPASARSPRPVAWLSLEAADGDLPRFLAYLAAAVQTIAPHVGAGMLRLLDLPQPPPMEVLLTHLLNDIIALPQAFLLVLDDYHVIEARAVDDALGFLLEHLPPQMHLVLTSRSDPLLPLARLRGRGALGELRAADLRFTPDEAAAYLNQTMGLQLAPEDVAALEHRTEGWITGLQMAALSVQGRVDAGAFIRAFVGSHRYVLDYLVDEVLQRQPERVRRFLLETAILQRLCAPLCDAVTGEADGRAMLEHLERANLFLTPLDDERRWYRYHHLFADVLRAHMQKEQPDAAPVLHRRASAWCEAHDMPGDAIRHALAAGDANRAASLLEVVWPAMRRQRQEATYYAWVSALPDDVIRMRPVLSVDVAWVLLDRGRYDAVEARLQDAERWLRAADGAPRLEGMIVVDETQFRSLAASIANARAYRAQAQGDVAGTARYAQEALALLPADDAYERGTTSALLGLAHWASGELEAAHAAFAAGMASLQQGGGAVIFVGGAVILAHMRIAQGRLHAAAAIYAQALRLARGSAEGAGTVRTAQGERVLQGTAELYLGLSELALKWGDTATARTHLQQGRMLGEQASLPGYEYMWCVAEARLRWAAGDGDGALALLDEAERLYYRSPIPNVQPIDAQRVRLWAAQGRLADAQRWAHIRGLSVADELSYLREYEYITLARILLAQAAHAGEAQPRQAAIGLLARLLAMAEAGERVGSVIEILVLQALACGAAGDLPTAQAALSRALHLAAPDEHVRVFVDEGEPMARLLRRVAGREDVSGFVGRLLRALEDGDVAPAAVPSRGVSLSAHQLVEPLSPRELDVLRLLPTELTGPEIADRLIVALSTVRTHTKGIYGKLGVSNRRMAVRRAIELGLL